MSDTSRLVVPSEIPWAQMKGYALEELLFWLCDAMGAQDLQWRAGSSTGTSRDRGRDLEATFHVTEPGGALRPERWWLQAKGRANTVPAKAVHEAVLQAQADSTIDVLVVATNTRISNDSRDWIREFRQKHPRPAIRVWEHPDLERMLIDHPSVIARVAPEALSLEGRLEAASGAYWNRVQLPPHKQLDEFWESRAKLEFATGDLIMLVVAEAARGGLVQHPWGAELDAEATAAALTMGLTNVAGLLFRAERLGHGGEPLLLGLVHLAACALTKLPADLVAELLENPWQFLDDDKLDDRAKEVVREHLIDPVVGRLRTHLGAACMADCERMFGDLEAETESAPEHRWFELLPADGFRAPATRRASGVILEKQDAICRAGLPLNEQRGCPFGAHGDEVTLQEVLSDLQTVLGNRLAQVAAERTEPLD